MIHEHVDNVFEEFRLFGAKESSADLIHHLFKFRQALVVFPGIVSRWQIKKLEKDGLMKK